MRHSRFAQGALMTLMSLVTITMVAAPASALTLIENGQARCTIIIPPEDDQLILDAEDLRYHLRKMSGAEVPIVDDPAEVKGVGIYIGTKPANVNVPGRHVSREDLWPDGYVVEIIEFEGGSGVFLSSPHPKGLRNAVYGLLEDGLGCHWFTIGEIGEHIPRRTTVKLNIPGGRNVVKPSFEARSPWFDMNPLRDMTVEEKAQMNKWYRRNRRGGAVGNIGHNWGAIFGDQKNEPDLWIVFQSERRPGFGLCMSSPRAVEMAAKYFINFFNAHPENDYYSFSQGDSLQWCECERCKEMGSNSGARMLIMSSRVAEKVAEVHPTKRIALYAYQDTLEPPEEFIQGHPNLNTVLISMGVDQIRPKSKSPDFRRQVERWMEMLPRAWSYDYYAWYNGPFPLFHALQETFDYYRSVGYTGVGGDEYFSRNVGTDVHMWLSFRMAWDEELRADDLLDEFYPAYFGEAASDMRSIYEELEAHMLSQYVGPYEPGAAAMYPIEMLDDFLARVTVAKQKITDSTILARLERDENGLKGTRFC